MDQSIIDAGAPAPSATIDGRNMRSQRTRAALLAATREFMRSGNYRPTVVEIARAADVSVSSVHQHFVYVDELYREAVRDPATTKAIFSAVVALSDTDVAEAFVLGKLPAKGD